MNTELEALARRAVACKHWRWMAGMRQLASSNRAPYRVVCDGYAPPEDDAFIMAECGDPEILPDLTDPATQGCVLALMREAWGGAAIFSMRYMNRWFVDLPNRETTFGTTEIEAIVVALEAAP